MNYNKKYQVLKRFYDGIYSYNEYAMVKRFFDSTSDEDVLDNCLSEQWSELLKDKNPSCRTHQHIYNRIEYKILADQDINPDKTRIIRIWKIYRQAAAILVIHLIAVSILYFFISKDNVPYDTGWVEINSPDGARTEFMLPDGSGGWLNSGSKIKYIPPFNKLRNIELSGEAYFDVMQKNSLFTVSVNDLNVEVYGTQFNVSAYPDQDFTEVVLASGKIQVKGKTSDLDRTLMPREKLTYMSDVHKYSVRKVETELYTSWKEGFLMLDNETLEQAASRIEKWYNVKIVIRDNVLRRYRFKATFRDEPVEELFRLIALTTPINYEIKKRSMDKNGVYQKKEIFLTRKK